MKLKHLLALACLIVGGGSLSVNAQLTDGTVYWIQDAATGQFLTRGGHWGTRAVAEDVGGVGFKAEYISDGVYKLQTVDRTLAGNTAYLGTGMYLDQNTQTEWSITASGEGYTISSGTQYLNISGKSNQQNQVSLVAAGEAAVWKFLTRSEYKAAIAAKKDAEAVSLATTMGLDGITTLAELEAEIAGTDYVTVDQTSKITNPTIANNLDGWTLSKAGTPRGYQENNGDKQPGVGNGCAEFWNGSGAASQTVTGLPSGLYKITMLGLYRVHNSDNATTVGVENSSSPAYVYANGIKTEFANWLDYSSLPNNRSGALTAYNNGDYKNTVYTYVGTDGKLELGVMCASWNDYNWQVFGQFTLTQIYSIAMYKKAYDDAMTAATDAQTSLTGFSVYASQKSTLDAAITANTLTGDDLSDVDKLTEAATKLNEAAAAVAKEKAACDQYASIASAVGGNSNVNLTSFVSNAGFEQGNLTGWTSADAGGIASNNNFSQKVGTYFVERWSYSGDSQVKLTDGTLTHDAIVLPAGVYQISATGQVQEQTNGTTGGGYFLCANDERVEMGAPARYSTYVKLEDKAELIIKFQLDGCTGNWISCDDVQLIYVGEDFPAYTLVDGKMSTAAATAQSNAETAFNNDKTVANYNALVVAITAAQASKDAYAKITPAVNKIDAALEAATTATESTDNYNTIKTAYTNGTIADADIQANIIAAYHAVIPVIKSQTAASADFTLAIQNQSFEYGDMTGWTAEPSSDTGVRETSNATYAATGSDGFYLFNTWWKGVPLTQTVTGLPNGQYTLTASVSSDGATIYLLANGEHNEGTETGGTYPTSNTFQEATITFLVKDGTATIGVVGGADGTAGEHKDFVEAGYWWYKADNFRLTKNRDLTPEEAAIVPTAIALFNGEDEVTSEIALDATTTSVTLTPKYTPADASEGYITWTTSDESVATVADGVVTAVAPGTATITVTSTLDENVKASCEVTVSFPESTVPATVEFANGAALNVLTLSQDNLIKNGTFGYPNAVATWKTVGYTTDALASNFTITAEGGAVDGGAFITTNGGGVKDATTIRKSVPVEVGKKYYFSVYTSGKAPDSKNFEYNALFKMTDATTENGVLKQFEWPQGAGKETSEWSKTEFVFTAETPYVGIRMGWNSSTNFDEFVLVEVTNDEIVGNVQYALDAIPTANIGTAAFQYSQAAIDAANALVQGEATVEDVEAAYATLTTLNAPTEGQLFNIVNITSGFAHNGKALTFKSASDADLTKNTTSMGWLEEPGSIYPQAVKFTAVEGTQNGYILSYTRADGNEVYISTGSLSGLGTDNNQIRPTTDVTKALTFVVTSVGDNHWYLYNTKAERNVGSNGDTGFFTAGGSNKDLRIQEAANCEVALNIAAANQYGTIILPFSADIPSGVTAYGVETLDGNSLTLDEVTTGLFAANTPYIVYAETGATTTLEGLSAAYTDATFTAGLLTGTYADIDAPDGSYVLQNQDGKVGFYKVDATVVTPKVRANRAYLNVEEESGVKAFYLNGNDADAIQSVFDGLRAGEAYDIGGRKISKLQKGVNIVGGRKVIVK